MLGLGVQNFVSAATGMAVVIALTRGLASRRSAATHRQLLGGSGALTLYILLPLS
jgi:K+-transporting ATPase ATPase A chain